MPLQIRICNKLLHITKLFLCHIELVMTTFERMSNLVTTTTCELISCTFWLSFLRDSEDKKKVGECSRPLQANITTIRCLPSTKENALGLHSWLAAFFISKLFLTRWSFQPGLSLVFVLPHKVYSNCRAHVSTLPVWQRFLRRHPEARLTQSALVPPYPQSGTSASSQSLFLSFLLFYFFFFFFCTFPYLPVEKETFSRWNPWQNVVGFQFHFY